jgi:hypothetical protein
MITYGVQDLELQVLFMIPLKQPDCLRITIYLHVESGGCPPKDTFVVISTTTDLYAVASVRFHVSGGSTGSLSLSGTNGPGSPALSIFDYGSGEVKTIAHH